MKKGYREHEKKGGNLMYDDRWEKGKDKDRYRERECECSLEIRDSIVVILCGDVEFDRIRDTITSAADAKASLDAKIAE